MTLIRQTHLDEAVASGILSPAEAKALADLAARNGVPSRAAQERVPLFSNFNEIFVSIGLVMLIGAVVALLSSLVEPFQWGQQPKPDFGSALVAAVAAAVAWGLTELLSHRRMTAPAIIAVLASAYFVGVACSLALFGDLRWADIRFWGYMLWQPLAAALLVVGLGLLRFRLPFLVLPLAIGLVHLAITVATQVLDRGGHRGPGDFVLVLFPVLGLLFLAIAMRRDLRDPDRTARQSHYALWLYLVALPLILFFPLNFVFFFFRASPLGLGLLVAIILAGTVLGLLLDRRTPVIATIVMATYALLFDSRAIQSMRPFNSMLSIPILAMIGCYVVALGVRWRVARRLLIERLPNWAFLSRLPPVS
jgi:hypothetical protein